MYLHVPAVLPERGEFKQLTFLASHVHLGPIVAPMGACEIFTVSTYLSFLLRAKLLSGPC